MKSSHAEKIVHVTLGFAGERSAPPLARTIGLAALFLAASLHAQAPAFDVVSIRTVPPDAPTVMRDIEFTPVLPGGQYVHSRAGLLEMISMAYEVRNPSTQLVGLPGWAKDQVYAVSAKPSAGFPALPPAENLKQVRLMLRAMLAERFQLRLHTETRKEPVFHMEVAKGGLKVKEVDAPVPPEKEGRVGAAMGNSGGRIVGSKSTMQGLTIALAVFLKRPVIDRTGLKGYFDFDAKWNAPDTEGGSAGFGAEGSALLISALQNQLGLRLTSVPGSVEYWVVDHVEPPTGN